jgi:3-oxoacyl-[acyl-carrier protein] reductase
MPGFEGRTALVTGAGAGIGEEIARRLSLAGARVLLNDADRGLAESTAARIGADGGACRGIGGDVADVDVVRGLVAEAVGTFGRLDIAVANAGLTQYGDFFDYDPGRFDRLLGVNLRGSYFLAQAAARQMRAQGGGGRILLLSSVTGHRALRQLSAYGMTKAALEMMARALVVDLSPLGITINAVAPRDPARTGRHGGGRGRGRPLPALARGGPHHGPDPARGRRLDLHRRRTARARLNRRGATRGIAFPSPQQGSGG